MGLIAFTEYLRSRTRLCDLTYTVAQLGSSSVWPKVDAGTSALQLTELRLWSFILAMGLLYASLIFVLLTDQV